MTVVPSTVTGKTAPVTEAKVASAVTQTPNILKRKMYLLLVY